MSNVNLSRGYIQQKCRRGMLELDYFLERFMEERFDDLSETQKAVFVRLLEESDPTLLSWFMGGEIPEDKAFADMVKLVTFK